MLDVRFAARLLTRDFRFTLVSLFILGLGIGINNMLFTILNAHTIRGLPIAKAERVLYVSTVDVRNRPQGISLPELDDLTASAQSFDGLGAFASAAVTVGDRGALPSW